jgi:hypothetical protein
MNKLFSFIHLLILKIVASEYGKFRYDTSIDVCKQVKNRPKYFVIYFGFYNYRNLFAFLKIRILYFDL